MGQAVLTELALVMAAAVVAAALLRRLHVPPVVGFIIAGILIGPGGFGFTEDRHQIEVIAEVGVMLLLFTVGLKLRLGDLWKLRASVFGGGFVQVLSTGGVAYAAALVAGRPGPEAVVWGAVAALSSTALVLRLLEGSGDAGTGHGRTLLAMLLFQDLAVVPIMLALPMLAGHAATASEVTHLLLRSAAVMVVTVAGARVVFPWVTARIVASGSRELFTLTTFLTAAGTALVFGHFGLSMALGAFLAGIVVSESEYVSRMIDDITPLGDVFNSLFFVSMGMLVDPRLWFEQPLVSLGLVAAVMVVKAVLAAAVGWAVLKHAGSAAAVGLGLAQVGEFSMIVAAEASRLGILAPAEHERLLAVIVPTLLLTPLAMHAGRRASGRHVRPRALPERPQQSDHVVIAGYGINGRNVARVLGLLEVPHVVIDLNPTTVDEIRSEGESAVTGDASRREVLLAATVDRARALVVAVADAASTRGIVAAARSLNSNLTIVARTRFTREVDALVALGADEVIPEEFETSLEISGRVLRLYGAPWEVVEREKAVLRQEAYGLWLDAGGEPHPTLAALRRVPGVTTTRVEKGSPAVGRTLRELDLRRRTGVTVLALEREDGIRISPAADLCLEAGDGLVTVADGMALEAMNALLASDSPLRA